MKAKAYLGMSLDGYIAGPNDDLSWLDEYNGLQELIDRYNEFIKDIDCIVMGSRTYEKVLTFPEWHYKQRLIVLTSQARTSQHGEEFFNGSLSSLMTKLRAEGVNGIYADGGTVVSNMIQEKLLDELTITFIPKILGNGVSLFKRGTTWTETMPVSFNVLYPMGLVQTTYLLK